jgi:hypothetical protein
VPVTVAGAQEVNGVGVLVAWCLRRRPERAPEMVFELHEQLGLLPRCRSLVPGYDAAQSLARRHRLGRIDPVA